MAKQKIQFECAECGYVSPKWMGSCPICSTWNSFVEKKEERKTVSKHKVDVSESDQDEVVRLSEIKYSDKERVTSNVKEFDRVLGGGFVNGSFLLLGGDPGIGKSTLMLQVALQSPDMKIFYVAGEESASQIKQRASRIGLKGENLHIGSNTEVHSVIAMTRKLDPDLLIIDSIQTLFSDELSSLPGSVQQVRECSALLQQIAKREGVTTLMIGHVTKEGDIAGPRILEHMVDTVLHFEGDKNHFYRLLRCVKNRFGPAQEVGVFEMKGSGLQEVPNPSALFMSDIDSPVSGSAVTCVMEGSRPILAEVQALVAPSSFGTPQRTASGFDQKRLSLLIAVLEKRGGHQFTGQDVYLNIAGGLKISDPAADLAVASALISSLNDTVTPRSKIFYGEVGLGGEVRKVSFSEMRLKEAEKMGFLTAVIPKNEMIKTEKIKVKSAKTIADIID